MTLSKLQKKLTAIFTLLAGLVLTITLSIMLYFNIQQQVNVDYTDFLVNMSQTQESILQTQYYTEATLIASGLTAPPADAKEFWSGKEFKIPAPYMLVVRQGNNVLATSNWTAKSTPEELLAAVDSKYPPLDPPHIPPASEAYATAVIPAAVGGVVTAEITTIGFTYQEFPLMEVSGSHGDKYNFSYVYGYGEYPAFERVEFVFLKDTAPFQSKLLVIYSIYLAVLLVGFALIFFGGHKLSTWILQPTAQGIKRQNEFVAAASHELRSPLTVLQSSLSAAENESDASKQKRYYQIAESETKRMSRLVSDLLLLAGGDAGKWQIHNSNLDMDTLLLETTEKYSSLLKEKNIKLTFDLPEDTLPEIKGDSVRLVQVLSILLDNAAQHSKSGQIIEIAARTQKSFIEIDVIDHGTGISIGDYERIFDRFYQADDSRSNKQHLGLGLSIAHELVSQHKGSIRAFETAGGGATFRISLPTGKKSPLLLN